jgi:phage tail protein X
MQLTKEKMEHAIAAWQTSGLSKKEFCRQRNIKYSTFHYWIKRIISDQQPGFTEVPLQANAGLGLFEIIFPSGVRISLQNIPSASWLREVVY